MSDDTAKSTAYIYLLRITGAALLAVIVIAGLRLQSQRTASLYSEALRSAGTYEHVSIGEKAYEVADGVVYHNGTVIEHGERLRPLLLAYEKTLARRNPIFSLAGTDPSEMEKALHSLVEAAQELAAIQKDEHAAEAIVDTLYPINFLRNLSRLERTRLTFLESGSDDDAQRYTQMLQATIFQYSHDVQMYRSSFTEYVPDTIRSYASGDLFISHDQTLAAINTLIDGIGRTQSRFLQRRSCVQGVWRTCDTDDVLFPVITHTMPTPASHEQLQTARAVREALSVSLSNSKLTTVPLLELDGSACLGSVAIPPLFSIAPEKSFTTDSMTTTLFLVGDIRLTRTADFPSVAYVRFFDTRGIPFIPSNPVMHYQCPYMQQDFGRAFALRALSEYVETQPLSEYATGSAQAELHALEQTLAAGSAILRESDARSYMQKLVVSASSTSAPATLRDATAALALQFKDPTAGFADAIGWVAEIEKRNMAAARENALPVDLLPETLFYYRSAFLLLFMGLNSSVTDTADYFDPIDIPTDDQPYFYFSELSASERDRLTTDLFDYYAIHRTVSP